MEEVTDISKNLIPKSQKYITPLLNKLPEIIKDRGAWQRLQSMGLQRVGTEQHEILQCYYQSQQDIHDQKKKRSQEIIHSKRNTNIKLMQKIFTLKR